MRRVRKFAVICVVWATAASTLLGSTPQVVCRCPNGQIKLLCAILNFKKSTTSCCCNGSCCESKGKESCCKPKAEKERCCCNPKIREHNDNDTRHDRLPMKGKPGKFEAFDGTCCQKAVAKAKVPVLNRAETKATDGDCNGLIMQAATESGFSVASIAPPRNGWRVHWLPPPTDLVTSLQRLTI